MNTIKTAKPITPAEAIPETAASERGVVSLLAALMSESES
jgi:hypothetical protein